MELTCEEMERRAKAHEELRKEMQARGGRSDGRPLDYIAAGRESAAAYQQAQYARIANPSMPTPLESAAEYSARRAREYEAQANIANAYAEDAQEIEALQAAASAQQDPDPASLYDIGTGLRLNPAHFAQMHAAVDAESEAKREWIRNQATTGEVVGLGALYASQQTGAPGKMFARMEILAVLRSRKAILEGRPTFEAALREIDAMIDIFTRME